MTRQQVFGIVRRKCELMRRDLRRGHVESHRRLMARAYAHLAVLEAIASVARPSVRRRSEQGT